MADGSAHHTQHSNKSVCSPGFFTVLPRSRMASALSAARMSTTPARPASPAFTPARSSTRAATPLSRWYVCHRSTARRAHTGAREMIGRRRLRPQRAAPEKGARHFCGSAERVARRCVGCQASRAACRARCAVMTARARALLEGSIASAMAPAGREMGRASPRAPRLESYPTCCCTCAAAAMLRSASWRGLCTSRGFCLVLAYYVGG